MRVQFKTIQKPPPPIAASSVKRVGSVITPLTSNRVLAKRLPSRIHVPLKVFRTGFSTSVMDMGPE